MSKSNCPPSGGNASGSTAKLSATQVRLLSDSIRLQRRMLRAEEGNGWGRRSAGVAAAAAARPSAAADRTEGPIGAATSTVRHGDVVARSTGADRAEPRDYESSEFPSDPPAASGVACVHSGCGDGRSEINQRGFQGTSSATEAEGRLHRGDSSSPHQKPYAPPRHPRQQHYDVGSLAPTAATDERLTPPCGMMMHPVASFADSDATAESSAQPTPSAVEHRPQNRFATLGVVGCGGGTAAASAQGTSGGTVTRALIREAARPEALTAAMRVARARACRRQPYDLYMVLDVEATCEENERSYPNEIIEFPVVLIDAVKRTVIDTFHSFVKPVRNPKLTAFCIDLTGITQARVDSAPLLPKVLERFESWLDEHTHGGERAAVFATDGPWDLRHFLHACHVCRDGLSLRRPELYSTWVNVRKTYSTFYKTRPLNLGQMLTRSGMVFEGRPHSGIDDARNIARVVLHLMEKGCVLSQVSRLSTEDQEIARLAREIEEETDDGAAENARAAAGRRRRRRV